MTKSADLRDQRVFQLSLFLRNVNSNKEPTRGTSFHRWLRSADITRSQNRFIVDLRGAEDSTGSLK